jgi:UrcA family protein
MKLCTIAVLTALILLEAGLAQPAPAADAPSVVVHYSDLDLSTPQGTRILYQRLQSAANSVCPRPAQELEPLAIQMQRRRIFQMCVSETLARAVAQLNRPGLSRDLAMNRPK